ncbi:MAG: glycosyl hydrolase 115 family protein [Muribaculaceae bacterium]|nr:glycosyl hydrolase 115 family protein [Muribaculaceae bacterium]
MNTIRPFIATIVGCLTMLTSLQASALDHQGIISERPEAGYFPLISMENSHSVPATILISEKDLPGISIAAKNLSDDFKKVCGTAAALIEADETKANDITSDNIIIAGSIESKLIKHLLKTKKLNEKDIKGKYEKYIMTTVDNPLPGVSRALVIAGSDRRGTIYGIYELSEQIGVSPWYDWADVTPSKHKSLYLKPGSYTAGEPAVKYRGIFLNDEAPCLTSWVKNTYGTDYGDHRFYARVFELLLRLRGNFMWPAMWGWAFYADDPENMKTADEMGIIMGTSHHEPMARNHQEWARKRKENGAWNYATNQETIDRFFTDGIQRMKETEDVVTIGMRGDGDEAMSEEADVALLKKVIDNQRKIIAKETGKKAKDTPQVWALYKEVLDYYDAGLRAPDDVIYLLCDDNWGNVRRLPNAEERKHPGGWGMYYHVDYVGAPRNSKLLNVTPIQNMWEQLELTYDYGVDKLWILNVGDLKPMEYPITLFLDMAWNPKQFTANNLLGHTLRFFEQQLGPDQAKEATRIFNLLCKYNGRVTPEMLDRNTYSLHSGEWKQVADDYMRLEAEALRQFLTLQPEQRDAYNELVLFPLQLMSNLYQMYYAQAMNHDTYAKGLPEANEWAAEVKRCFDRDADLMKSYNNDIAGGKWNGMMTQKHIGYTSWNDAFPADILPETFTLDSRDATEGGYVFQPTDGAIIIEAEHFNDATDAKSGAKWEVLPYIGRTLSGVAVRPYTESPEGASLKYAVTIPEGTDSVTVHVVTKSTLAFQRKEGHRYTVGFEDADPIEVNFNANLNEDPQNIYSVFYPTVARRVVEKKVPVKVGKTGKTMLEIKPLDPGIVFEKIVIDLGGYTPSYLFGKESKVKRGVSKKP